MSDFIPEKKHLREVLLFLFNIKKTSAESCRMLVESYGHNAPSESTCRQWFRRFKNHNFTLITRNSKEHQKDSKTRI